MDDLVNLVTRPLTALTQHFYATLYRLGMVDVKVPDTRTKAE